MDCRSCGQPIAWATTAKGHRIPLDPDPVSPDARGAMVLVPRAPGSLVKEPWAYGLSDLVESMAERLAVDLDQARALVMSTYEARLSHFATCPDADRHRSRRQPKRSNS